jgi:uncharacterized membrane protein (UPF0127 family)
LLLGLLTVGIAACAREKKAEATGGAATSGPKSVLEFFPIKVGERTVRMQLAVRPDEMQRGLMGRRDLGRDDGMIFVYDRPQQMTFWMRNTPTPLDIGFFRPDGVLAEIYALHPFDEKTVSSRGTELKYALEMNQGWYQANGVKPGAQLDLKALAAALQARGFVPAKLGL